MQKNLRLTASTPLPASSSNRQLTRKFGEGHLEDSILNIPDFKLHASQEKMYVAQRTRAIFNIIARPPLLHSPSFGIELPFTPKDSKAIISELEKANDELRDLACSDACFLSIDGLLDGIFVARSAIEYLYEECSAAHEVSDKDDVKTATLSVLDYFLGRVTPILNKLGTLRVGLKDFRMGEIIGRGACGVVRVVKELAPPNSVFAMKSQFKGTWLYHDPEGSQLLLERTVLAQAAMIDNPWLPHLYYAFQDETQLHLVMDYEPGGDMYIFLSKTAHLLDPEMIQFYAAEVVEAVHSLHQMGYIHCDIKPENFAIERSGHLKLIDFGSAIRLDPDGKCVCPTMVGTKEYLNIELLTQRKRSQKDALRVGPEYDYWAVGVFIYEMFYGYTPFYDEDDDKMMDNIRNFKTTLKFPKEVQISESAKDLIRRLICQPTQRLCYGDIVEHHFFQDVDFATIRQHTPPYLPPVGEVDDVSNFSGGASRIRDEQLLDMSADPPLSPSRTVPHPLLSANLRQSEDIENIDPAQVTPSVETNKWKKRQAIYEAATAPIKEDVQEVEDVQWQGPAYAQDLPFVGFSFTPGLLLGEARSRQLNPVANAQTINNTTLRSDRFVASPSNLSLELTTLEPTGADDVNSSLAEKGKIMDLMRRNRFLTNQLNKLRSRHEEEVKQLLQCLNTSRSSTSTLPKLDQAVNDNLEEQARANQEIARLDLQINKLTDENKRLTEELDATRKSLLDFGELKSLVASVDRRTEDEVRMLRIKLNVALEDASTKTDELNQVRLQLERLRGINAKLVAERDVALERSAKAEELAATHADEAEAARLVAQREIHRLATTTQQQGKLINHLCGLLPPEHRPTAAPVAAAAGGGVGGGMASSLHLGAGGKPTGHSALFLKARSILRSKKSAFKSSTAVASSEAAAVTAQTSGSTVSSVDLRPLKRFRSKRMHWVRNLSTLRSKNRVRDTTITAAVCPAHGISISDDEAYVVPHSDEESFPPDDNYDEEEARNRTLFSGFTSDVDHLRSSISSSSVQSSCVDLYVESIPSSSSVRSQPTRRRAKVLWAEDMDRGRVVHKLKQPGLLKQISKVLIKGKPHNPT
uniref:Citron Rho-interacting kinase n=1 Tax=Schistocephalus solidus TaxID=70667 RepID=A0A0V0JBD3_SCHSO